MNVNTKTPIKEQLIDLIEQHLDQLELPRHPRRIYTPFRYVLSLGGKRIRPYLVLLGCGISNGTVEKAIPAALAVELLHNFTLVHDDIMDQADTRRGKSSVHSKWGTSNAILTGDIIFSKAFSQLLYYGQANNFNRKTYQRVHQVFLEAVETVCEGQALDLDFAERPEVTLDEYLAMITRKTAFMVGTSLQLGGIIAENSKEAGDQLFEVGQSAGIAFQIQDDMLDVIGNPDKFGKQVGGDIREGKKTYMSILAAQRANSEDRILIDKVLKKNHVKESEIQHILDLYQKYDVIEAADEAVKYYYTRAIDLLREFPGGPYKSALKNLIDQLSNREQ